METITASVNPFEMDTEETSVVLTPSSDKSAKPRVKKEAKASVVAPVAVAPILEAPVTAHLPALPVTLVYGPAVIQNGLSEAIGYHVDGMPLSKGRTANCALATSVAIGDYVKYHKYLKSLSNLLKNAARDNQDASRLLKVVLNLVRQGMNTDSCLRAFAHIQTGGTGYPEPHRAAFVSACFEARKAQGEEAAHVEQACRDFGPVYDAFASTLSK